MTVLHFPAGSGLDVSTPGDFVLIDATHRLARATTLGQRRRFDGEWAAWNHAAFVVDWAGTLAEVRAEGVCMTAAEVYRDRSYAVVHPAPKVRGEAGSPASYAAVQATASAMRRNAVDFVTVLAGVATSERGKAAQARLCLELMADRPASSPTPTSLVAHALARLGYVFDREPRRMLPADLALAFNVRPWRPEAD